MQGKKKKTVENIPIWMKDVDVQTEEAQKTQTG